MPLPRPLLLLPAHICESRLIEPRGCTGTRKGKLKNSQYLIKMPSSDPRFLPPEYGPRHEVSDDALESALYCGKVRSPKTEAIRRLGEFPICA